jgi:DNA ligase-1
MSASWVKKLNESDSRLHKEDVIRQALEAATLGSTNAINFLTLTKVCYNPYHTFGVKQVPDTVGITDAENPWDEYNDLLHYLGQRALTGHAARDAIAELSEKFDSEEWNNFLAPVLRRDLRAGISDKTINKICKGTDFEIPIFGCQLATNSENRPEMKGFKRLEPKLDGVRVVMMVNIQDVDSVYVTCYSRNGKIFDNFTHIEQQIKENIALFYKLPREFHQGFILDGEVVGNSFQELMRQARRKENVQAEDSVFHIFDILPKRDFSQGVYRKPLRERIEYLEILRPFIDRMKNVELLHSIDVDLDYSEGVNPYVCKRSTDWMKWKPTITVDLTVIALEQGTGRNSDRLGALVCEGEDDGKYITVNVGSGFSDEDRDDYWSNQSLIIGRTAEVLCDAVTQNQDGTYSLRFPRFVRFRDDK